MPQVLRFEFQKFRILEIFNFHWCVMSRYFLRQNFLAGYVLKLILALYLLQAHILVADASGACTAVFWNEMCPKFYHR